MICPDCGGKLVVTGIAGVDNSFRCEKCGGVRVMGWLINRIAENGELKITPKEKVELKTSSGELPKCPEDQLIMVGQSGEELPPEVPVWKCGKCGWLWLPGNSVFDLKAAYDTKREYVKVWKKPSPFKTFALPVLLSVFLFTGLAIGNRAIRQKSTINSQAAGVENLIVRYKDGGKAEIRFISRLDVGTIVYRLRDDMQWKMAAVVKEGAVSVVQVQDVNPGDTIWVSIGQQVEQVTVGEEN